jgi:tetratricopeptide (TPR) repeat protein
MTNTSNAADSLRPELSDVAAALFTNSLSGASAADVAIGTIKDTAEGTLIKAFVGWVSTLTPAGRAAKSYAQAQNHLMHYRYREALEDLTEALGHDSDDVYLLRERANVYKHLKQYENALQDSARAMALVPDNVDTYIYRAKINQQQGNTVEAIADFQQALHYSRPEYRLRIQAELYHLQNQLEQAFEAWSAVIADPALAWNRTYAHWQRAYMAQKLERYDQALADYSVVLDVEPNNVWALNQRANVYAARHEYLPAIIDISRSIELERQAWAFAKRGEWYAAQLNWAAALADDITARQLDPKIATPTWRSEAEQALARLTQ